MRIGGDIGPYPMAGFLHVRAGTRPPGALAPPGRMAAPNARDAFLRIRAKVAALSEAVADLGKVSERIGPMRFKSGTRAIVATAARATSASNLGFLAATTAAVMRSAEEVNATPTSFSPFGPAWTKSTAQATIEGAYDGSNGTTTLTFQVHGGGTHGVDSLRIKVLDGSGLEIEQINIKKQDAIDKQYTLSNGLVLTLGEGELLPNDTFTLDVDDSIPMSFSPALPQWIGSSGLATLDGVYDGSNGATTLTFEVTRGGTRGTDNLQIKVFDATNQEIDQIDIDKAHAIDQEYTLSNGLVFTLGEGDLLDGTTMTLDVYDTVGSVVDPDQPLDGLRNDDPNLEYGFDVTAGTFEVNGTTIEVYTGDTINTVLDRITQSAAGVSATFDADTEMVVLTQKTLGSTPSIVLGNDTSGFLAATKLENAPLIPGSDGVPEVPLADTPQFASVQSGSIYVNGIAISINVDEDSLNDVLDRINASGAGVTASLNETAQRVTIVSNDPSEELVLDSGVTGFFPALEIADNTYLPTQAFAGRKGMTQRYAFQFAEAVQDVADALNALFEEPASGAVLDAFLMQLRQKIETEVQEAFDSESKHLDTQFGVEFDFRDAAKPLFDFSKRDRNRLASALIHTGHIGEIRRLFFGKHYLKRTGLVAGLTAALKHAESDLAMTLGSGGLLPNVWA